MQAITLEVILRAVFGVTEPEHVARWSGTMRGTLNTVSSGRRILALASTIRSRRMLRARRGPWARLRPQLRPVDEMIFSEVRTRREERQRGDGPEREDVLSLLLAARDEDGQPMTDTELRDELMTLLVAGHETTATALAWTLERITRTPHVLERLYEHGGVDDDDYIDAVCKESLRLRPVVPAAARELQEPMTLGGVDFPAGVVVAPSIVLMHLREDIYPQPHAFRPERFLERPPGTYEWIPFGGGVRRCLGASFALFEMRAVLKAILQGVRLDPTSARGEGVRRRLVTLVPAGKGRVTLSPVPVPVPVGAASGRGCGLTRRRVGVGWLVRGGRFGRPRAHVGGGCVGNWARARLGPGERGVSWVVPGAERAGPGRAGGVVGGGSRRPNPGGWDRRQIETVVAVNNPPQPRFRHFGSPRGRRTTTPRGRGTTRRIGRRCNGDWAQSRRPTHACRPFPSSRAPSAAAIYWSDRKSSAMAVRRSDPPPGDPERGGSDRLTPTTNSFRPHPPPGDPPASGPGSRFGPIPLHPPARHGPGGVAAARTPPERRPNAVAPGSVARGLPPREHPNQGHHPALSRHPHRRRHPPQTPTTGAAALGELAA